MWRSPADSAWPTDWSRYSTGGGLQLASPSAVLICSSDVRLTGIGEGEGDGAAECRTPDASVPTTVITTPVATAPSQAAGLRMTRTSRDCWRSGSFFCSAAAAGRASVPSSPARRSGSAGTGTAPTKLASRRAMPPRRPPAPVHRPVPCPTATDDLCSTVT